MTLEWIAPTATAAVGLAGIAATWLTARASRIDQRNMVLTQYEQTKDAALRETRRKAYATLLANLYSVSHSAAFVNVPGYNPDKDIALVYDLSRSLAEVKIIGSDPVRQLADQVAARAIGYKGSVLANENEDDAQQKMRDSLRTTLYILERLMASDLGIPVSDAIEEWERPIQTNKDTFDMMKVKREYRESADSPTDAADSKD